MNRVKHIVCRGLVIGSVVAAALGAASPASAGSVTAVYTTTGLTDMVHQNAYTWEINGVTIDPSTITGATLKFYGFFNWTNAGADPYNILWLDLLDKATNAGNGQIASMTDDTNTGTLGKNDVLDGFRYSGGTNTTVVGVGSGFLVAPTTSQTYIGSSRNTADATVTGYGAAGSTLGNNPNGPNGTGAFTDTPAVDWQITFGSAALTALENYITNGQNFAIGLDSDCHFGDTSVELDITYTTPSGTVPEPGSMALLGTGILAFFGRRKIRQAAQALGA